MIARPKIGERPPPSKSVALPMWGRTCPECIR